MKLNLHTQNLFMFPFAGGNSYSFNFIKPFLSEHIVPVPLDLPGRGSRLRQPLLTSMETIALDILNRIEDRVESNDIFWGHSMGALSAFLVIRLLHQRNKKIPKHLIVTGRQGPSTPNISEEMPLYQQPKDHFFNNLIAMGGTPPEVFQVVEMRDLYEPILRADFQALATYQYQPAPPLPIPITCIVGDAESIHLADLKRWELETSSSCSHLTYVGDHFFISRQGKQLAELIEQIALR